MKKSSPSPDQILIIGNGAPISRKRLLSLGKKRFLLALDGAAELCRKGKFSPHLILGDFDGISKPTRKYFESRGVALVYAPDQNFSDMEKALQFCLSEKSKSVWITCALGLRTDHTLANLSFLKKYSSPSCELVLFSETEEIRFVRNRKVVLTGVRGATVSLLGFPAARISSHGLQYEMKEYPVVHGRSESLSNQMTRRKAVVDVQGEALLIQSSM